MTRDDMPDAYSDYTTTAADDDYDDDGDGDLAECLRKLELCKAAIVDLRARVSALEQGGARSSRARLTPYDHGRVETRVYLMKNGKGVRP